jgi:hypothetical protein
MPDPTPAQSEQLKFLLADFNAIKAEIARRSTLQRVALGAYVAVIGFVFNGDSKIPLHLGILAIWIAALLTLLFWASESLAIGHLGSVIKEDIASEVSGITEVPTASLLPSECPSTLTPARRKNNAQQLTYGRLFYWTLFLFVPSGMSVFLVPLHCPGCTATCLIRMALWLTHFPSTEDRLAEILCVISAIGCVVVLSQRFPIFGPPEDDGAKSLAARAI